MVALGLILAAADGWIEGGAVPVEARLLVQDETPPAAPAEPALAIDITDDAIVPAALVVPSGGPLRIDLHNVGRLPHTVVVPDLFVEIDLLPGETRRITLSPDAGSYAIFSSSPGDLASGLVGSIAAVGSPDLAGPLASAGTVTRLGSGLVLDGGAMGTRLRLERVELVGGGDGVERVGAGPGLLATGGEALLAIGGAEEPVPPGLGRVVPAGTPVRLRAAGETAAVAYLVALHGDDPAGAQVTPIASPAATPVPDASRLFEGALGAAPSAPFFLELVAVSIESGAEGAPMSIAGTLLVAVESGTASLTGPSGIEGAVPAGRSLVVPPDASVRLANRGTEPTVVLVAAVAPVELPPPVAPPPIPTIPATPPVVTLG